MINSAPQSRGILRDLLALAAIGAGIWITYRLGRLVVVVMLAIFFAYVIAPLVDAVQHRVTLRGRTRRVPPAAAIAAVYVFLGGALAGGGALIWPAAARQLDDAIASGPKYTESFRVWARGWTRYYEHLRIPPELRTSIDASVLGAGDAVAEYARGALLGLAGALVDIPWLILVPVLAFLLLKDAAGIRRTLLIALPHRLQLRSHRLVEELNATLAAYVRAQLIACVVVGVLCTVGFALIGQPYAILLGALAAVAEFVPLMGPLFVAAVAVAIAALNDPMLALWTGLFLAALRVVQDYVIYPRLIGRDIHLHPLAVILAVVAGVELGGIAGIFVAVPVVALLSVAARHWLEWRAAAALAGESDRKSPSAA